MIEVLFSIIIFALIGGVLYWLVLQLPLPEPFATILRIAVVLICIILFLGVLFGGVSVPWGHLRKF